MALTDVLADVLHQVECEGPPQAGHDAQAVAIVAALAAAGLIVVSAEDLRTYLDRGKDLKAEVDAFNRLRAALPERGVDGG